MEFLGSLLTFVYANILLCILLELEFKNRKNLCIAGLLATGILLCAFFVGYNYGYSTFMRLYPLLIHIPSFIALMFISKYKGIKLVFVQLTVIILTFPPKLISLIISSLFDFDMAILSIVSLVMDVPMIFLVYLYLRPLFLYMLRNTDKGWYGFCMIPFSYTLIVYFTGMSNLKNLRSSATLLSLSIALVLTLGAYSMILRSFKQTREQLILEGEQTLLHMQVSAAQMHLEELKESQEKTRIYRHDMRYHLSLINSYLADNNMTAAQNYIAEIESGIERTVIEHYCSNYTVNLILYSYIGKAKNEQITVKTQMDLSNKNIVSDMDLCVIFANAIENAINACKHISIGKDRTIQILCKTKGNKLFIQVINSYEGKITFVNDMPISPEENHGHGTKSIAAVAQKYNGIYSFTAEDGIFKTSIIL